MERCEGGGSGKVGVMGFGGGCVEGVEGVGVGVPHTASLES